MEPKLLLLKKFKERFNCLTGTVHGYVYFSLKQGTTKDRVFAVYIYFTKHPDEEVCQKAITGLGKCIHTTEVGWSGR